MSEIFKVSVSKSKTFLQCKKQYHFNYILKFPKKTHDYHVFGKFCHKVLEDFHRAYVEGSQLPYNLQMKEAWKAAWAEFKDQMTGDMKKECWDLINRYLRKISGETHPNVIAVEKKFELILNGNVLLNGAIDIIRLDDNNVVEVADYKTTKNKKYLVSDWFQLMVYGFVLVSENPELDKVRASYILLRHDFEVISQEFNRQELLEVNDKILEYAEQMQTEKQFPATPSNLCGFCDFMEHCVEGKTKVANSFFNKKVYGEVGYGN
jgi:RecB family exonuclease